MKMSLGMVAAVSWGVAVASGFGLLCRYESAPGSAGPPPDAWPAGNGLARDGSRPNVLMFAHPRCPCTMASLIELERLADGCKGAASIRVLFFRPEGAAEGWARSAAWSKAESMPGVTVQLDPGGAEARRFGAATSGHVLVFDVNGRLAFSGGITRGRGVEGPNDWSAGAAEAAIGVGARRRACAVFGCPLGDRRRTEEGRGSPTPRDGTDPTRLGEASDPPRRGRDPQDRPAGIRIPPPSSHRSSPHPRRPRRPTTRSQA
ncbi:hypothetical protein [Paludisphaera mucosa]|uniref:RedB protein n=1 Tax=Paludisphaera mucosa TaxID=3030827 RepID=A0ABT6FDC4_9BACT|nr:hypothetical protein [Paludisphaera mucosa]MDG3005464.1 hypothetical protein [Paludisphaera mucosa]